jgi:hypothetical protein
MKRIAFEIGAMVLILGAACAWAQTHEPTPPPELKKLNVWLGDWTLSGTARDEPGSREYALRWRLHEHWVLKGFFLQVDQIWRGNGQVLHSLEMLSYDPRAKIYTDSGFASDGSTWSLTASFHGADMIETGVSRGLDGAVTTCRMTWVFGQGGRSLSGTEICARGGTRWTAVKVSGLHHG